MREELLRALLEARLISEDHVEEMLADMPASLGELERALLAKKWVKEGDLFKIKSQIMGASLRDVTGLSISREVLQLIPEETAFRYKMVPLALYEQSLDVGMVDPSDVQAREALKFLGVQKSFSPNIVLIREEDFNELARQYRTLGKEVSQALQELERELEEERSRNEKVSQAEDAQELTAEAPITKVVAVIIRHAVEGSASDIHIEPQEGETRVRFRVDGILHSSILLPKKTHAAIAARIKILSNLKIDETRVPQDGRFETVVSGKRIDFRISVFPTSYGEKVVLRILDPTGGVGKFEELGLVGRNLEIYRKAIEQPYGMVLITGPTGSGKSTTLYTTLTTLNSDEVNMTTLEDPIEYYIPGVNQSQIRPDIGFSFATGLRSMLRQDPDVIMVGEIRDKETATLATHAALTGHLVFSTLHTNNAIGIVPRLVNMGIDTYLLPPTLIAGVAQRLVRKLCQECREETELHAAARAIIEETVASMKPEEVAKYAIAPPYKMYKSKGCPACGNKGTKGRIAIFEVFEMTSELEAIVLEQISETKLAEELSRQGMITMKQDGIMKVLQGLVSFEEVLHTVEE